jgi:hypothetical protein
VSFLERVGGALVSPRATLRAIAAGANGRGAADVALLIAARLICGELPRLVRAWFRARELGFGAGVQTLFATVQTALPDLIAILVAALVMSLFAGRPPKREQPRADALDLAAYAWVPYLAITVLASIYFSLRGLPPSHRTEMLVSAIAIGWACVVWLCGLAALRDSRREIA